MAEINLSDYLERKRKAGSITVDLGEGHGSVEIPPLELWADEVFDTAASGDTTGAIVLLLGEDGATRFVAAGGNYRMLSGIVRGELGDNTEEVTS